MIHWLGEQNIPFPDPNLSDAEGMVAVGGNLSPQTLLKAYSSGIFPWFNPGDPIIWWSPDPRYVIVPSKIKVSRSMRPYFNQNKFEVTFDAAFENVIIECQSAYRKDQQGDTWITDDMLEAYLDLHHLGYAHSVEIWCEEQLVGGLYGVSLGKCFFGESMFSLEKNASKFGLISLARQLEKWDFDLIDCQMKTDHLIRMGAQAVSRIDFLKILKQNDHKATHLGSWSK